MQEKEEYWLHRFFEISY